MTDNMPYLIGLGGKLRAGKDALGDYLESTHGYVKMGMSDALNEALLKLNPVLWTQEVNGEYLETRYQRLHDAVGYVEAKKNPEVRRLLQILGTEVGREMISEDVWVNIAEKKIREYWAEGKRVVITAIRFPNELDMLNRLGGISLWVERPDAERLATGGVVTESARSDSEGLKIEACRVIPEKASESVTAANSGISEHASETSVNAEMFGYTIINDGTLEDLYRKAEEILPNAAAGERREKSYRFPDEAWHYQFLPPYDR